MLRLRGLLKDTKECKRNLKHFYLIAMLQFYTGLISALKYLDTFLIFFAQNLKAYLDRFIQVKK